MAELIARTYADALFEVGVETNKYELIMQELQAVDEIFKNNLQFMEVLKSPLISKDEKKSILSNIFKEELSKEVTNFFKVLIDQKRIGHFSEIKDNFKKLLNDKNNIVEAVAVTAVPLNAEKIESLKAQLSKVTGKNVVLENQIDPTLLGGVLIQMGNEQIDGSVKGRLENLKEELQQIIA